MLPQYKVEHNMLLQLAKAASAGHAALVQDRHAASAIKLADISIQLLNAA